MTKSEMIALLAGVCDIKKDRAATALAALTDRIARGLVDGERIMLPSIGVLQARPTAAIQRRNPRTGEPLALKPAGRKIRFRAAKALEEALARPQPPAAE